ncbi:MAG: mannonate dehydratase [Roseobacter sp.]
MKETWRWFGPADAISLQEVVQTEARGIVSALHHIPIGDVWSTTEIEKRQTEIMCGSDGTATGLTWDVVESLPVSEDIKRQTGDHKVHISTFLESMENIARAGIEVICYNFMPLIDWTRTALEHPLPHGGNCMRFDYVDFAAFDVYVLKRAGARNDYSDAVLDAAKARFDVLDDAAQKALAGNIIAGLPGTDSSYSLADLRDELSRYDKISAAHLRQNYVDFLEQVTPAAERLGLRLCCHPDDPPFSLLGLPRVMSTEADYAAMREAVDSPVNGITLCSGSLGARADNDLPGMMTRLGDRVHFIHLRNVKREDTPDGHTFHEAAHLDGDTNMPRLIAAILKQEALRKASGRNDWNIPFRPDHGQAILDDLTRQVQPGYPLIGRLKGLAELRGSIATVQALAQD